MPAHPARRPGSRSLPHHQKSGSGETHGVGSGANPRQGREAAPRPSCLELPCSRRRPHARAIVMVGRGWPSWPPLPPPDSPAGSAAQARAMLLLRAAPEPGRWAASGCDSAAAVLPRRTGRVQLSHQPCRVTMPPPAGAVGSSRSPVIASHGRHGWPRRSSAAVWPWAPHVSLTNYISIMSWSCRHHPYHPPHPPSHSRLSAGRSVHYRVPPIVRSYDLIIDWNANLGCNRHVLGMPCWTTVYRVSMVHY